MNENEKTFTQDHGTDEKTFTQDDVNRIVGERLAKEKAKSNNDTEFSKKEKELEHRELCLSAKEMLNDKGLPGQLLDALNCSDKETMEKSISIIESAFEEYKKSISNQPVSFKGFVPASSTLKPNVNSTTEDMEIRKAMRLDI